MEDIAIACALCVCIQFWFWLFIVGQLGKRLQRVEKALGIDGKAE
ncbi:hypothetical protein OAU50_06835 [Planctomycetota bacterium]|nr:hypothetical protein [Planctomycetota bacterium]